MPEKRENESTEEPEILAKKTCIETEELTPENRVTVPEEETNEQVRYKLKIENLKKCGQKEFKSFLESVGVNEVKISKNPTWTYAFLSFLTEKEAQTAYDNLIGKEYRGQEIKVVNLGEEKQRQFKPRPTENQKQDDRTPAEKVADQVSPLWRMPYPDQLKHKQDNMKKIMKKFGSNLKQYLMNKDVKPESKASLKYIYDAIREYDGLPCPLIDIAASPVTEEYRTKCEFTFGKDPEGNPTVGFLLGLFKDGYVSVLNPSETMIVHPVAKQIANVLQEYIRLSEYPVYDRVGKKGFWRISQIRTQNSGEVMIIIQINPTDISEESLKSEKQKVLDHIIKASKEGKISGEITTVLFQDHDGAFNGIVEKHLQIAFGPGYVQETLLGTSFQISPTAFFQVNTPATELLYSQVRDWCWINENNKTLLLDLCCGTGTIGQLMASHVKHVIGVDIVADAIKDAEENAKRNNITNVTYIADKVENAFRTIVHKYIEVKESEESSNRICEYDDVVAVLDPPRSGVHSNVIRSIRECKHIKRVIYVSCSPASAMSNFVDLCRPPSNKFKGPVFKPVRAQAFDLFPHTDHCELVIEFQRASE